MTDIETCIAGIPAIVRVTDYIKVKGSHDYNAPSDMDFYGYQEYEYDVCDRRGRPAPWLEKKLTGKDRDRIDFDITKHMDDR
jgi:hypothetical protein